MDEPLLKKAFNFTPLRILYAQWCILLQRMSIAIIYSVVFERNQTLSIPVLTTKGSREGNLSIPALTTKGSREGNLSIPVLTTKGSREGNSTFQPIAAK